MASEDESLLDAMELTMSSGDDAALDCESLLGSGGSSCCSKSDSVASSLLGPEEDATESCGRSLGRGGGVSPRPSQRGQHGGVPPCPRQSGIASPTHGSAVPLLAWAEAAVASLLPAQRRTLVQNALLAPEGFLVGSDCSGSDAAWEALRILSMQWHASLGCKFQIQKEFCSEHPGKEGDAPRNFLYLNSRPRLMVRDMCDRGHLGFCSYRQAYVPTPTVDVYSAGWVCRDASSANTLNKKPVTMAMADTSGESTKTLHASIKYIRMHRPKVAILENIVRKNNVTVAVALLRQIRGYAVVVLKANSLSFATCTSRPRLYILAINLEEVTITTPLRCWGKLLDAMSALMPRVVVKDYLLPDDHPHVRAYLQELRAGAIDRDWRKCRKRHDQVRKAFSTRYGKALPGLQELREQLLNRPRAENLSVLTPRQLDCYGLHLLAASFILGTDLEEYDMVMDVTNNVTMASGKDISRSGSMPCLLRNHQYVHTSRRRPLCGSERMRVQGFSRPLVLVGANPEGELIQLSQRDLCALAGDTISVPVIGALLTVVFACCLFQAPSTATTAAEAEFGLPADGVWVGTWSSGKHPGTVVDTLPMASSDSSNMSEEAASESESLL